jgi:segregation and condensation protein A
MSAPCTVKLAVFEGPLDLLLHLIKRSEVEITDIPIAAITDQYLAMLDELPELNLDGAGEYLVMAATLMFIKSRMLLPAAAEDEEPEEDPRAELVQQLLEYQRYREVAVGLGERSLLARDVFASRGEPLDPNQASADDGPAVRDADLGDLVEALRDVLKRLRPPISHEVPREKIAIRDCVQDILARFVLGPRVEFASLFTADVHRARLIATFLALLELIRLAIVRAVQAERFGPITLELRVGDIEEAAVRVRDLGEVWRGGEEAADGSTSPDDR